MKKVLIISYYFPPLGLGGTQRMAKFARYLTEFGWQPTVISVQPIVYWAQDDSLLKDLRGIRIIRTDSWDPQRLLKKFGKHRNLAPAGHAAKPGKIAQFLNQKLFSFFLIPDSKLLWNPVLYKSVANLLRREHFDAVLTSSPPHSTHLAGKKIAAAFGLKWIADFRDDWAGGHVVFEPSFLHRRINLKLQDAVVAYADAVICASPGIKAALLTNENSEDKFHIITNGFDAADYPQVNRPPDTGVFILCYCGVISKFSDPTKLFMALLLLKENYPADWKRLKIQFVGHDASGKLEQQVHDYGLNDHVELTGFKPHDHALQYVVNADALLLLATGSSRDTFIPGKTFEYFGAQKPVFCISNVADTTELLKKYRMAEVVTGGNPANIASALHALMQNKRQFHEEDLAFIEQFNRKKQTEQLAKILNGLVSS